MKPTFILLVVLAQLHLSVEYSDAATPSESIGSPNPRPLVLLGDEQKISAPDQIGIGGDFSLFGQGIDVDGTTAVVGAPGAMGHGLAFVYEFDGNEWLLTETLIPDDGQQGDEFGFTVDIMNDRIVIGAWEATSGFDQIGKVYIFDFDTLSQSWTQSHTLVASDQDDNDEFGRTLAQIDGAILVGAPGFNDGNHRGQVYVFEQVGNEWLETHKIPGLGDFGSSVHFNNALQIFIGADEYGANGMTRSGAVFVYDYDGVNWQMTQALTASDGAENHYFGTSMAFNDGLLAIGADKNGRFDADGPGAVYLFEINGQLWQEQVKLVAPGEVHFNQFGSHLQLGAERLFISSLSDSAMGDYEGLVHVFEKPAGMWSHTGVLGPFVGSEDEDLGFNLALSGDELLIGAFGDDTEDNEAGSFFGYSYAAPNWQQNSHVHMLPGAARNFFGARVVIKDNHMMIGSYGDDGMARESGSVYVYQMTDDEWVFNEKINVPDNSPYKNFGYAIDIQDNRAIIGAPALDVATTDAGAAFVFQFNGHAWEPAGELRASDGLDDDYFGGSVSIYGDYALIGASGVDTVGDRSGAAYVFKNGNHGWSELRRLEIPFPAEGDYLGVDVDINDHWAVVGQDDAVHFFDFSSGFDHFQTLLGAGNFGSSLAIDGQTVVIGSFAGNNLAGYASIYEFNGSMWENKQYLNPTHNGTLFFGKDVAISGSNLLIGTGFSHASGVHYAGSVSWYYLDHDTWKEADTLVMAQPARWDLFGEAVSIDGEQVAIGALGLDDFGTNSGAAYTFQATDLIFRSGFSAQ